jgi:hypothetical protein
MEPHHATLAMPPVAKSFIVQIVDRSPPQTICNLTVQVEKGLSHCSVA